MPSATDSSIVDALNYLAYSRIRDPSRVVNGLVLMGLPHRVMDINGAHPNQLYESTKQKIWETSEGRDWLCSIGWYCANPAPQQILMR